MITLRNGYYDPILELRVILLRRLKKFNQLLAVRTWIKNLLVQVEPTLQAPIHCILLSGRPEAGINIPCILFSVRLHPISIKPKWELPISQNIQTPLRQLPRGQVSRHDVIWCTDIFTDKRAFWHCIASLLFQYAAHTKIVITLGASHEHKGKRKEFHWIWQQAMVSCINVLEYNDRS